MEIEPAPSLLYALAVAALIGSASGAVGSFIILRRMALVGDALSHVALPGIALALILNIDPLWGVVACLLFAAWVVWELEQRTSLSPEALVGILFTASLAIGVLVIPDHELVESLFGAFPAVSGPELALVVVLCLLLTLLALKNSRRFLFSIVSPDLARSQGISRKYDLLLLLIFSTVVALGIKLVGTLLMGALTIIPATVAKNYAGSMRSYILASCAMGLLVSVIGLFISRQFLLLPGPTIILTGIALFLLSLVSRRNMG